MTEKFDLDRAGDYHFGVCPICHKADGYANAYRDHIFFCKEHKKLWLGGSNVFSSCREQTQEEQREIWNEIGLDDFEICHGQGFSKKE
jgi:hypothetical protein